MADEPERLAESERLEELEEQRERDERRVLREFRLNRVHSPLAAWALSFGCIVGWGAFLMPSDTFLPAAGPAGTAIAFVAGALVMIVIAVNYGYMARHCPDAGGVYSYVRQQFGPNRAFVCSWCLVLTYIGGVVANATALSLLARSVLGNALQFGLHYTLAGYDVYLGEILLAVAAVVLAACVCISSVRLAGWVQVVLAVGLLTIVCVVAVTMFVSPAVTADSLLPAFSPGTDPLLGTLIVAAEVPWAFVGFEAVSHSAGESRFPARKMTLVMILAIVCGCAVYLVLNVGTAVMVPDGYENWAAYIADVPNLKGLMALPSFHATYQLAGDIGLVAAAVAALLAVLTGLIGFFLAASRLIFAMARDGALPARFARLRGRSRTPVAAMLAIAAIAVIAPIFGRTAISWAIDLMSLGALVAYDSTSMAALQTARSEKRKVRMVFGMAGVVLSLFFVVILIVPIPGIGSSLSMESYVLLVAWIALGVNFYRPTIMR